MQIAPEKHTQLIAVLETLRTDRLPWWQLWRELAEYYLPRRYVWLVTENEYRRASSRSERILDPTGTSAARTLAAGMMNGITSPSRPWFKLRVRKLARQLRTSGELAENFGETSAERRWCDEVERRMLAVMAESNFYNALAVLYLDIVVFGSGAMLIYEDFDNVINCYNPALGEFYFGLGPSHRVEIFGREFKYKLGQCIDRFGIDNLPELYRGLAKTPANLQMNVNVGHLLLPNKFGLVPSRFRYFDFYWIIGTTDGNVLELKGYNELPGVFPRWEVTANDAYGSGPGIDALPDVIQLQHETKVKGKSLDRMAEPPMLVDMSLRNNPMSFLPRGITYVNNLQNNSGARPAYQVNPPVGELSADIMDVRQRIREIFHNDLFKMISQLDTVRSATEIDARREEKLVLLGSVLERFETEALDPAINRIFSIMLRKGLIPDPPPEMGDAAEIDIQYVSILTTAQRAVGVAPVERLLGLVGNLAGARPGVLEVINWDAIVRNYARDIGVPASNLIPPEQSAAAIARQDKAAADQVALTQGQQLVEGAKTLSETEVGGGVNALQTLLGG